MLQERWWSKKNSLLVWGLVLFRGAWKTKGRLRKLGLVDGLGALGRLGLFGMRGRLRKLGLAGGLGLFGMRGTLGIFGVLGTLGILGACQNKETLVLDHPAGTALSAIWASLSTRPHDRAKKLVVCPQEDKGRCRFEAWSFWYTPTLPALLSWTRDARQHWEAEIRRPTSAPCDCPSSVTQKLAKLPTHRKPLTRLRPPPTLLIARHLRGYTFYLQGRAISQGCKPRLTEWIASPILPTIPDRSLQDTRRALLLCLERLQKEAPEETLLTALLPLQESWPRLRTMLRPLQEALHRLPKPPRLALAPLAALPEPPLLPLPPLPSPRSP